MDSKDMDENGIKTRSFRFEDYNNRRVFLRSYPLYSEPEDEENKEEIVKRSTKERKETKPMKKIILSVLQWGEGKVFVFKMFKHKITFSIIACLPVGFKPPAKALISA